MTPLPALGFVTMTTFLVVAMVLDVRHRRIPNGITVSGALVGLLLGAVEQAGLPTAALAGSLAALVLAFPLFALGALGAGDAKLLAMVGTFVGLGGLPSVLLYSGVAGGLLALGNATREGRILPVLLGTRDLAVYLGTFGRHGERRTLGSPGVATVPYGVAIGVGALAAWLLPLPFPLLS